MCANTKVGYETIVGLVLQYHQCQNKDCPSNAWIAGSTAVYDELGVFCSELCLKEFAGKQAFPSTEFEEVGDWSWSQSVIASTGNHRWIEGMAGFADGMLGLFYNVGEHGVLYNPQKWAVSMDNKLNLIPVEPQGLLEKGFLQAVIPGPAFKSPRFDMVLEKVKRIETFIPIGQCFLYNVKPIEPAFARYA